MPGHVQQVVPPLDDCDFCPPQKNKYAWVIVALVAFLAGLLAQSPLLGVWARAGCRAVCGTPQ